MADDLADVLLHDSDRRWRTLRAEGDEWADPERSREAFLRNVPRGSVVSARGTPGPVNWDPTWKLWLDLPRSRADFGALEPLPPPGPLGVVVEWERRGLPETRADLDAGAIVEAASRAETLWS